MKVAHCLISLFFASLQVSKAEACVDDDQKMAQLAAMADPPGNVTSCSEVAAACNQDDQRGAIIRQTCCATCSASCVDDDAKIAELAAANGYSGITACVDVVTFCRVATELGNDVRQLCCATCADASPFNSQPESEFPPTDETVQVFLLSGQSECTGSATASDLAADASTYPALQGDIEGVWFAGYSGGAGEIDRFFIAPMSGGIDRERFGPEISFGERIYSVTKKRTIIMKYCVGGTHVHGNWNPETTTNQWDRASDDGTAKWLGDNGGLDFKSKNHLFKNMIYTIRRTKEELTAANVPFEWAGIIWVQGQADLKQEGAPKWKVFGEDTARVWEGFREEIGSDVPIVDTGATTHNQMKSGKEYATQIVKGCKATTVEFARAANDDTPTDCIVGPTDPCMESPNMHQNFAIQAFYGYDPLVPDDLKPDGFSSKTFAWFSKFPLNLHSAYEGMILKGRMLANEYIREFTSSSLGSLEDDDPAIKFPFDPCTPGTTATDEIFCWIDYRDESLMMGEICDYGAGSFAVKRQILVAGLSVISMTLRFLVN